MTLPADYKPLAVDAIRTLDALGGSVLDDALKACYWKPDYATIANAIDAGVFGGEGPAGAKQHDRLCEFLFRKHPDRDVGNQLTFKILDRLKNDPDEMARLLIHGVLRKDHGGEIVHLMIGQGADIHRPVMLIGKDRMANEYDLTIYSAAQAHMSQLVGHQVGVLPYLLAEKFDHVPPAVSTTDGDTKAEKSLMASALEMARTAVCELLYARLDKTSPPVQLELDSILTSSYESGNVEMVTRLLALGHAPAEPEAWNRLCGANPASYPDGSLAHLMLRHSDHRDLKTTDGRDMVNVALEALLANGLDPDLAIHDSLLNHAWRHQNKAAFAMILEAGANPAPVDSFPVASDVHREMLSMAHAMSARQTVEGVLAATRQRSSLEGRA
jgi:chemotaxis protein CheY-P-specific phosphatase CheC